LRLLGFDTSYFTGVTDTELVDIALAENRIILTRDTHILERRLVVNGKVKTILIHSDNSDFQIQQVSKDLFLYGNFKPFSLCLECNHPLERRLKEEVKEKVPPYVWQTRSEFMQCTSCLRIYWKGTHWEAMIKRLKKLDEANDGDSTDIKNY
jgi:uncharacterized protein with PIN domain